MSSAGLTVSGVDFRIIENAKEHLTQRYEVVHLSDPSVVLRRGQDFTIQVHFRNGRFDPSLHQLTIVFDLKPVSVLPSPGSRGEVWLGQRVDTALGWKAALKENRGDQAVIQVRSPSIAAIGEWVVNFVMYQRGRRLDRYTYPGRFYLLFNPWNSADQVHMPEEQLLDEYVYNDVGKMYQRDGDEIMGQPWVYGQFDKSAILAAIKVLELSDLTPQERGNPVKVSRAITYMANSSSNENGILEGHWPSGDFPQPSTRPWEWTSSLQILEEYVRTGRPVKYGQCWVFAAVVNTVCRALGMPTRAVTTINSAHDHNRDLALSNFYDEHHKKILHPIYTSGLDQEWSFHVWNETWMQRPDLPLGYGGWQAIDGTPQGLSEGKYQCGPASVEAIRNGQVGLLYNVGDFIAATNADLITWKRRPNGDYRIIKVVTNKYGTAIYTKKPYTFDPNGETDRADIVHRYKYPEGSQSERIFLMNAVNQLSLARTIYDIRRESWTNDIEIKLSEISYVPLGQELKIPFRIKNKSDESCEVKAAIAAVSMFYNGLQGHFLHRVERTYQLAPGREETMFLEIGPRHYVRKLVGYGTVHAYAAAMLKGTKKTWIDEIDTGFRVPKITFEPLPRVRVGQRSTLRLNTENPLNETLTGCKFLFFAPGVSVDREMPYRNINPRERIRLDVHFRPVKEGVHTLTATFMCRETMNFIGRVTIQV